MKKLLVFLSFLPSLNATGENIPTLVPKDTTTLHFSLLPWKQPDRLVASFSADQDGNVVEEKLSTPAFTKNDYIFTPEWLVSPYGTSCTYSQTDKTVVCFCVAKPERKWSFKMDDSKKLYLGSVLNSQNEVTTMLALTNKELKDLLDTNQHTTNIKYFKELPTPFSTKKLDSQKLENYESIAREEILKKIIGLIKKDELS